MVSALISRFSVLVFGYLYPAYRSYKAVKTRDVKEYVKWMMYWIVFALYVCLETLTDWFVSMWMPFYYELKIIFLIWLLSPYTKGATYIYRKLIHPTLSKHEDEIDLHIERFKKDSTNTLMRLGSQGVEYAREVVATVAVRSQLSLVNQLKKSYSLNDLAGNPQEEGEVQGRVHRDSTRIVYRSGQSPILEDEEFEDELTPRHHHHPANQTRSSTIEDPSMIDGELDESSDDIWRQHQAGYYDENGAEVVMEEFQFLNDPSFDSDSSNSSAAVIDDGPGPMVTTRSVRRSTRRAAKDDANLRLQQHLKNDNAAQLYGTLPKSNRVMVSQQTQLQKRPKVQ